MKRGSGFTLIEVLVSVAVMGIITGYLTLLLVQQSRGYEVVEDVSEAQQNERSIGDLMEHDVMLTGMMVEAGAAISGYDNAGPAAARSDVLCVSDAGAVDPTGIPFGNLGISVVAGYTGGNADDTLTLAVPTLEMLNNPGATVGAAYDNDNPPNGVADSDFFYSPGTGQAGGVILASRFNPGNGSQCGLITNVAVGGSTQVRVDWNVAVDGTSLITTPTPVAGGNYVAIPAHIYYVRPGAAGRAPQLMRDRLMIADDVEDLQVAYFFDGINTGACDANEWRGGDCPDPGLQGFPTYQAWTANNCILRAVRFNLVVRTANQDAAAAQNPALAQNVFPVMENAPARPGADGFRRRVFTRTVLPRNGPSGAGPNERGCS
jgi:prepilin-type N-terminal cleavage/methylation domain-containing protein